MIPRRRVRGAVFGIDTAVYNTLAQAVTVDLQLGNAFGQGTDTLTNIHNVTGSQLGDAIGGDGRQYAPRARRQRHAERRRRQRHAGRL